MTSRMQHRGLLSAVGRVASSALVLAVVLLPAVATAQPAPGVTYQVLYTFSTTIGATDGGQPVASLILDSAGNLYGTAQIGGTGYWGVAFKLDAARNYSVLYNFTGGADGATPRAALVLDSVGNLYGTTMQGGTGDFTTLGVVFKLDSTGKQSVLYTFNGTDGANPNGALLRDSDGTLYSTTQFGGGGNGVVFKLDPTTGTETVLHAFTGSDGAGPTAAVIRDSTDNLVGTTQNGGDFSTCAPDGCGVVFKLDPATGEETVLYTFTGLADGRYPTGDLIQDSAGNLYGTTSAGGGSGTCIESGAGCGVVFKLDPTTSQETVLYTFTGGTDGWAPGNLFMDNAGILYGVTALGGIPRGCGGAGCGLIYQLDPATGKQTVLYSFMGGADGGQPSAGLIRDSVGNFYGTTGAGGSPEVCGGGCGVVYKFSIAPAFALSASALTPDTVSPGGSATSTVDIAAIGGFSDFVTLTCSVQPSPARAPQCSIPNSTTPGVPVTMTVSTTGPTASAWLSHGSGPFYALWLPLLGLVMAGAGFGRQRKRKGRIPTAVLAGVLLAGLVFAVACGGGSVGGRRSGSPGTPPGAYTITVTGTSGSLVQSTNTTLTVQ